MSFVNSKFFLFLRSTALARVLRPVWRVYNHQNNLRKMKLYAIDALSLVVELFEKNKMTFWLDFGTLLGAVRVGDFLSHDGDIDLAAHAEDAKKIEEIIKGCEKLSIAHEYFVNDDLVQISFEYHGINIDLCFYKQNSEKQDEYYCYLCHYDKEISDIVSNGTYPVAVMKSTVPFDGVKTFDFRGLKVNIPNNEKGYLTANYGADFMIPNKNWDYINDAPNLYQYPISELQGLCVLF